MFTDEESPWYETCDAKCSRTLSRRFGMSVLISITATLVLLSSILVLRRIW